MALESLLGSGLSWLSWWDGRLTAATAIVLLPLVLTYALTYLKASWIRNAGNKSAEPPQVPYAVPIVGNTLQFAYDTEGFLTRTLRRFKDVPFTLKVGLEKMYYIPYGEPVQAMFKHRDLSSKPIIIVAMRDQFGMPPEDLAIFERDGSGGNPKPLPGWEHMPPEHRIFHNQHRDLHNFLNGASLDGMTTRFIATYTARLRTTPLVGDEWTELPDLFGFLRNEMFHAACTALVGERIFELCPDFAAQFWDFDRHAITYLRRTPRWMAPQAYAIRDKVLASVKRWRAYAREQVDPADPALADVEYEPVWGARLLRARARMFDDAGASPDGAASMDLGLLWAANANVIPATGWALLNVLLDRDLTERALAEVRECYNKETGAFDVPALCSRPLLNGIYLESLRYSVATTSARNPVTPDFELLGGWKVPRDALMLSISWFGARDRDFWNTGRVLPNGKPEHPVDSFWAERFLEYPDDLASGPVRKPDEAIYRSSASQKPASQKPAQQRKTPQDDKRAKIVNHTAALQGYFFPYGGGPRICPGRHFAKQEMMAAVAVILREFEIELTDPVSTRNAKPDLSSFPTGATTPDRKIPVRIRRRQVNRPW